MRFYEKTFRAIYESDVNKREQLKISHPQYFDEETAEELEQIQKDKHQEWVKKNESSRVKE